MTFNEYYENMQRALGPDERLPDRDTMLAHYIALRDRPFVGVTLTESDTLLIDFEGGGQLQIWDAGQSCCEHRYTTTDDDLSSFVGAKLVSVDLEADGHAPPDGGEGYDDVHETQFVRINTTMGTITMVTHNEHNGYYGGFAVNMVWVE